MAQAAAPPSLVPFGGCSDLLARMKHEALHQVTAYGLPYGGHGVGGVAVAASAPMAAPAAASGSGGSERAFSTTNNQEAGVDEADLVKTDGGVLVVLRRQPLGVQVVDVAGDVPRLRGFLPLPESMYDAQLLLVDGRAVVVGTGTRQDNQSYRPQVRVLVLSLADPAEPRLERSFEVDGTLSAAREIGGRVLLVLQSGGPDVVWSHPRDGSTAESKRALRENRRRIQVATLDAWLPTVRVPGTGRSYRASCSSALRAQSESGTATTSVLSLDPRSDVPGEQVAVAGSGSVVYASPRAVYVTTWPWSAQAATTRPAGEQDVSTDVHRFDVTDPAAPRYTGSGSVPGTLIGQYALSEHEGHLRVASTVGRSWAMQGEEQPPSDNLVTVLRLTSDALVQVGQVKGLGRGERIFGVRFLGDLGYVVTFRQTDPLYVLDLADPGHPARRGELHVTGYSSYLHPLGAGLLLGIGQEVEQNRAQGTQVSTFDVSDDSAPRLRARKVFDGAWSAAEHDPHAVLWWPASRLVVVPMAQQQAGTTEPGPAIEGVVVLRVGPDGALGVVGRLAHPQDAPEGGSSPECCWGGILRSVVLGDALLTFSDRGVLTSALDTLEERAWAPYR